MAHKIGPKEQQRIDLRLKRYAERGPGAKRNMTEASASKPINAPVRASAPTKETTVRKLKKKPAKPAAKKRSRSEAAANRRAAKASVVSTGEANKFKVVMPKARKAKAEKTTVPALEVAAFMARPVGATPGAPGGASMAELVAEFGIEAHPMRAKIHYVRHKLGWNVEIKDGRYYATEPKAKAA